MKTSYRSRSPFTEILKAAYDTECRVNTMLCRVVDKVHSPNLKRKINEYVEHNGLTLGKLHMLFHLTGVTIQAKENPVVSEIIDSLPRTQTPTNKISFDRAVAKMFLDILRIKIYNYTALAAQATELRKQVATILNGICYYERKTAINLTHIAKERLDGHHKMVSRV